MTGHILVTYGSWAGSAVEVAEEIGQTMADGHAKVDILSVKEVKDLLPYDAVIVGSAIHASQLHPDVLTFIKKHKDSLVSKRTALFVVCLAMKDDDENSREIVSSYLDIVEELAPGMMPVATGLFAGAMIYKKLPLALRLVVKVMKAEEGDYRDWDAIRDWARSVREMLDVE